MAQLNIETILALAQQRGLTVPAWRWPPLKPYNGFSHAERVRGWQAERLAVTMGLIPPASATSCSVCGARSPATIDYHAEDYTKVAEYSVCRSCHTTLHQRFTRPIPWLQLVARHGTGSRWFENI